MFKPIHKHLILNLTVLDKKIPDTPDAITSGKAFLVRLVRAVGMKPVTVPQVAMVTEPGNEGPTGSINLATSHIAYHYWSRDGRLMLDLYSCCTFDHTVVYKEIEKYFGKFQINIAMLIDRDSGEIINLNV